MKQRAPLAVLHPRGVSLWCAALALMAFAGSALAAPGLDEPVEQGRRALERVPQAEWYDPQADQLRPIPVPGETEMPSSRPGSPPKPKAQKTGNWNANLPTLWGHQLGALLMYFILFVVLGVITFLIIRAIRKGNPATMRSAAGTDATQDDTSRQVDRIEHLPFEVRKKDANLLQEARRCYEAGNYNEAIVYLFSFQLLELDKAHVIRLAKGKTNGQYLRETVRHRPLRSILQQTMNAFEDVFFGNRHLTRERFEGCWNELPQFEQLVQGGRT